MIYVDLDDVIGESSRMFLRVLERQFSKKVLYEQLVTFDLAVSCGLNKKQYAELMTLIHSRERLLEIEPVFGATRALARWASEGYEIAIVTGRPDNTREATEEWLARYQVIHHSLIMIDKYGRSSQSGTRMASLDALADRSFSAAVEDSLETASYLAQMLGIMVALPDRPWNQSDPEYDKVIRCHSWDDISEVVRCPGT